MNMVSPSNRLNYLFHYYAVPNMPSFEYESPDEFVTGFHSDSRRESLDMYAESFPSPEILDSASAAIVYYVDFDGQAMKVRLEYAEGDVIGVQPAANGKASEFVKQITDALKDEAEVRTR